MTGAIKNVYEQKYFMETSESVQFANLFARANTHFMLPDAGVNIYRLIISDSTYYRNIYNVKFKRDSFLFYQPLFVDNYSVKISATNEVGTILLESGTTSPPYTARIDVICRNGLKNYYYEP